MDTTTNGEEIVFVCTEVVDAPVEHTEWETPELMMAHHQALRDSAIAKLKNIGLTEDEAKAVIGL
jgi:hypothetical protein